jgi:hypothetical protein
LAAGAGLTVLGVGLCVATATAAAADSIEGPSEIAVPADLARAKATFEQHAKKWMADLERNEAENRRKAQIYSVASEPVKRFDGYGDDYETQVKATGHAGAPFVGILRYKENLYTCLASDETRCTVTRSIPVSEIFSFKNGRWTY